jgi:hypothetical protein
MAAQKIGIDGNLNFFANPCFFLYGYRFSSRKSRFSPRRVENAATPGSPVPVSGERYA